MSKSDFIKTGQLFSCQNPTLSYLGGQKGLYIHEKIISRAKEIFGGIEFLVESPVDFKGSLVLPSYDSNEGVIHFTNFPYAIMANEFLNEEGWRVAQPRDLIGVRENTLEPKRFARYDGLHVPLALVNRGRNKVPEMFYLSDCSINWDATKKDSLIVLPENGIPSPNLKDFYGVATFEKVDELGLPLNPKEYGLKGPPLSNKRGYHSTDSGLCGVWIQLPYGDIDTSGPVLNRTHFNDRLLVVKDN